MADTNWVNTAETALTMSEDLSSGGLSTGTLTKGSPAVDYGIDVTYTSGAGAAIGPLSIYVAKAGTAEVTAANVANMTLVGSHTPVSATAVAQVVTRVAVGKAFSGQVPDSVDVAVLNGTGIVITALTVTPIRGYYATT